MLVRMVTTYASPRGTAGPGNVIDLPEDEATLLVTGRYATLVQAPVAKAAAPAPVETQVDKPAEPPAAEVVQEKRRKKG